MNDTTQALAEILEKRCSVIHEIEGRNVLLAHINMVDVTKRPDHRRHSFARLNDMVLYAIAQKCEHTAVFYDKYRISLCLDELWDENVSSFEFVQSDAVLRWIFDAAARGPLFDQQRLIDHLECWKSEIVGIEGADVDQVINRLINLTLAATITYERKYQDQNNIKLLFNLEERKDGETATFPKRWTLNLPIFDGGTPREIPVQLRYKVPTNEKEHPAFYFEAPTLSLLIEQEVEAQAQWMRAQFAEFDIPVYKGKL